MTWWATGAAAVTTGAQVFNSLSGSKDAEKKNEALINAAGVDTSEVFNVIAPGGMGAFQGNIVGNTGANESLTFEQLANNVTSVEQNPDGSLVPPTASTSQALDASGGLNRGDGVPEGPLVDTGLKSDGKNTLLIDPNSGQIFVVAGGKNIVPFNEQQAFGPNGAVQLDKTDGGFRLDPAQFMPGGELGTITLADGTQINSTALTAGDLEPVRAGQVDIATIATGKAGQAIQDGLSPEMQELFKNVADTLGVELDLDPGDILAQLSNIVPGLVEGAAAGITEAEKKQFGGDIENRGTSLAENSLAVLEGGFEGVRASTLANLRDLARPANERAADRLATRLFGTGRLGTTGGSQLFADLAGVQSDADLKFQLAANKEAREAGQFTQDLVDTGLGAAERVVTTADELVSSATDRFTDITRTGITVGSEVLQRQEGGAQFETGQAADLLKLGIQEETLPGEFAGQFLDIAEQGVGITGDIQEQVINVFDVGQQAGEAATSARQADATRVQEAGTSPGLVNDAIGAGIESIGKVAGDIFGNLGKKKDPVPGDNTLPATTTA